MKLLFVYQYCGLGGVETSILNKLDALNAAGIDARVAFGEFYGSGGTTLAHDSRVSIGLGRDRVNVLLREDFDAISVVDHPDFIDLLHQYRVAARVLFETHVPVPEGMARFHTRLDHPRVDAIVVPAEFNRRVVNAAMRTAKQVAVIPNPIDLERFSPGGAPEGTPPLLLAVGRLEDVKNPREFLKIGEQLLDSGRDVRLLIVGDAYDTAEYEAYKQKLIAGFPPRWLDRLEFRRYVPNAEMPDVYRIAANSGGCLVSSSRFESSPMTIIEATGCLCPVVSTEIGGVAETVRDGVTGFLYRLGDIDDAVRKIAWIIDPAHAAERQAMVETARAELVRTHGPGIAAAGYRELIESLPAHTPLTFSTSIAAGEPGREAVVIPGMVSTIIPVYNRMDLLREAVDSVLAQTYRNFELILVDDGSTDGTGEFCDRLAAEQSAIRVIHTPHQGRAGLAREAGRRAARGEYLQYLDSDDLIMPAKFERMVAALEENRDCDIAYCYTRRYRIGETPEDVATELTGETHEGMFPEFLGRRYWHTSTPLYRRRLCDRAGPWSDLLFWEDIEYDFRIASLSPKLCHCKDWLTDFRDHSQSRLSGSRFLNAPSLLRNAVAGSVLLYRSIKKSGLTHGNEHVRRFIDDTRLIYNRCVDFGMQEEARQCAEVVTDATGDAEPGRYRVRARIEPLKGALIARPRQTVRCPVRVTNLSTVDFHRGEFATELGYHLRNADGTLWRFDNPKIIFEEPLGPGESGVVDLPIDAPSAPGLFYAETDILWGSFTWLSSLGNPCGYIKLLVGENLSEGPWRLHLEPGNSARLTVRSQEPESARLEIQETTGRAQWDVQINYERLPLFADRRYELRFEAKADEARPIAVAVGRARSPWDSLGLYTYLELAPDWQTYTLEFTASDTEDQGRVHFDAGSSAVSCEIADVRLRALPDGEPLKPLPFARTGRLQIDTGLEPASSWWGTDRGLAVHRYYLEQFLAEFASDIRGQCLEFQEPQYAPRFGGSAIQKLDIVHIDGSNPQATLVADLTQPNNLPTGAFDCIVCSHVLHVSFDVERAVSELHRVLKPGGVLLVAVPHISMYGAEYGEVWRFTPKGLETLLERAFGPNNVIVRSYGNSLAAAGEIRGAVAAEFLKAELDHHDSRFPVEVCARAVKQAGSEIHAAHGDAHAG